MATLHFGIFDELRLIQDTSWRLHYNITWTVCLSVPWIYYEHVFQDMIWLCLFQRPCLRTPIHCNNVLTIECAQAKEGPYVYRPKHLISWAWLIQKQHVCRSQKSFFGSFTFWRDNRVMLKSILISRILYFRTLK